MASSAAPSESQSHNAELSGSEAAFCAVLQEVSSNFASQVKLAGGCLALHPSPPPGFRDNTENALSRLRRAMDEFWVDIAQASGPNVRLGPDSPGEMSPEPLSPEPLSPGLFGEPLSPAPPNARRDSEEPQAEGEEGKKVPRPSWAVEEPPRLAQPPRLSAQSVRPSSQPPRTSVPLCEVTPCSSEPLHLLNLPVPSERPSCHKDAPQKDCLLPEEEAATKSNSWVLEMGSVDDAKHTAAETSRTPSDPTHFASTAPTASTRRGIPEAVLRYSSKSSDLRKAPSMDNVHLEPTETESVAAFGSAESMREDSDTGEPFAIRGALNPNWLGRLGWDFGVIAIVLVDAMVLPFQMAYKHGNDPDAFDVFWLWLTTSFFSLDMVISFFTAYVASSRDKFTEPGRLVTRRLRILRHYLRGWFTIDFVSTIPWSVFADLMTSDEGSGNSAQVAKLTKVVKFVRFLRLMRMLRLAKLGVIWERIEAKMGSLILLQVVALIRVLLIVVSICHWNACIWWMVGQPSSLFTELLSDAGQAEWEAKPHWTMLKRSHDVNGEPWSWIEKDKVEAYVFCFYWTLGVMRTMPSEVQPVNLAERVYVMLFMFFAVSAFAISVTLITQAFLKIGERRRIFNEDMAFARMHLRNIQASETLQMKVKAYLKHLFDRRRIQAKEANLFGQLPPPLTKLMKFSTIVVHLKRVDLLSNLGKRALYAVSEASEVTDLVPNERLATKGMVAQAAFIVVDGFLRIVDEKRGIGRRSSEGDIYEGAIKVVDEDCLLSRRSVLSKVTVSARTACEVVVISKRKFLNVVKENPALFVRALNNEAGTRASDTSVGTFEMLAAETDLDRINVDFERGVSAESFVVEEESPAARGVTKTAANTAAIISA